MLETNPIIIPKGNTSVTFNIIVINDDMFEGDETFNLDINCSSLPTDVVCNEFYRATVTIIDDEKR